MSASTPLLPEPRALPLPGGKGERTRLRILEAAITRFALHGFRRTTVADIARDAGLTPAATYAYFDCKDSLFFAAVDADTAALVERAVDQATGDSVRDTYWSTIAALRELVAQHPLARRVLAGLEPNVAPQLLGLPAIEEARLVLVDLLREGQASGEIRADVDVDQFATGLEVLVLSVLMAEIQFNARDDDFTRGVVAVIDAALRPPPH